MRKVDPVIAAHLEWLGFVQPTGLVVSARALAKAGAVLTARDSAGQDSFNQLVEGEGKDATLPDFVSFAKHVLGWDFGKGYGGTTEAPIAEELTLTLPDYGITLRPEVAVAEKNPTEGKLPWQLLVSVLPQGQGLDAAVSSDRYEATPHSRTERLLRHTGVPAALLFNGKVIRLLSAPHRESSGWLDFAVADMTAVAGRPMLAALRLLLSQERLLAMPKEERLAALLQKSREYQNDVSEQLAQQVLHALYELVRGFQSAHDSSKGELLKAQLQEDPDEVYRAMLTVILRLVFLLFAEERDMLPEDEVFLQNYSVTGLHKRLVEDAALYPDTMDQRYGAWSQLVSLFRMVHGGASGGGMHLQERRGDLFDPDRFPFLEGRVEEADRFDSPLVPDGSIYRVLEKLLILDGERISYRALDVEQIGSVYETMMGFRLERGKGKSIAIKANKKNGAPTTIDLEALLEVPNTKRDKWMQENAGRKLTDTVKRTVAAAETLDELHAGLHRVIDHDATPDLVPAGAMVLQPSEERRKSGSHYTPRSLTEPIVRTTLHPILDRLRGDDGKQPKPEQILTLKVCDPAMGSGAFLVETCRQLGEVLRESWHVHKQVPTIPQGEDEIRYAQQLIAQRCIYGVDRNPMAVDLAKVSLWLLTLARDQDLMFLDHALRQGDSLVGLGVEQILSMHWDESKPRVLTDVDLPTRVGQAAKVRVQLCEGADEKPHDELVQELQSAEGYVDHLRMVGDSIIGAFFAADRPASREAVRSRVETIGRHMFNNASIQNDLAEIAEDARRSLSPFHWELEFPEVFTRKNPGFDAIVGNPPFAGKNTIAAANPKYYPLWLKEVHEETHGNADLVAHFYRRAFRMLRRDGAFGLIATNTIAQGDTRSSGLRWICTHGGELFAARKRVKWPGEATVVVSVVHAYKGNFVGTKSLDGKPVDSITAFLFHRGGHEDPLTLEANAGKSFQGSIILGMGFTFDDTDTNGVATPIAEMHRLIAANPSNQEVIFPFLGFAEVSGHPQHQHHRFVIDFRERSMERAMKYTECWEIIQKRVKPERQRTDAQGNYVLRSPLPDRFWQHAEKRPGLYAAIAGLHRVLATASQASAHFAFAYLKTGAVFSSNLAIIALDDFNSGSILHSRVHEVWTRRNMSTLGDGVVYTVSDCFETYPFPTCYHTDSRLETAGQKYFEYRSNLMVRNDEGLTKTYNRFHDPEEQDQDILKLRELHEAMDRAVLDAYSWVDIPTNCDFLLDYEDEEDEGSRRKKPWRYRWPDDVRDEVLGRLLALNAERASEEVTLGRVPAPRTHVQEEGSLYDE